MHIMVYPTVVEFLRSFILAILLLDKWLCLFRLYSICLYYIKSSSFISQSNGKNKMHHHFHIMMLYMFLWMNHYYLSMILHLYCLFRLNYWRFLYLTYLESKLYVNNILLKNILFFDDEGIILNIAERIR